MKIQQETEKLRELWGSFRPARVLFTANNFGLFDELKSPKTAAKIADILHTDVRATEILLDALTGLGLVKKHRTIFGKSASKYKNSALSNHLLVKRSPYYQGDIIRHAQVLWENWSGLDEVLETGKPFHKVHEPESFIKGMHNIAILRLPEVIKAMDLKNVKRALDLGGGPGTYSMGMARKGVSVTLFDRPEAIAIAKEIIKKAGVSKVDYREGDFLTDDIGKGYDLVFISQVLHSYSEQVNISILRKAGEALHPGGRVVVQEFYIDHTRTLPVQSALFSINMLVNTDSGRCYSPSEISGWLSNTGFRSVRKRVVKDHVLITAKKGSSS